MKCGKLLKISLYTLGLGLVFVFGIKTSYALSVDNTCTLTVTSADNTLYQAETASSSPQHLYYYRLMDSDSLGFVANSYPPSLAFYAVNDLTTFPMTWSNIGGSDYGKTLYLIRSDYYYYNFEVLATFVKNADSDCSGYSTGYSFDTQFTSFTYSTTTQYARIQGKWHATTTPGVVETLTFYQDSILFGKQNQIAVTATTTGNFDFSFFFTGLPVATSTQNRVFGLYALINQVDDRNIITTGACASAPFSATWEQCGQVKTLLTATSTIVNSFNYDLPISPELKQTYSYAECGLTHFDLGLCLADISVALFQPLPGDIETDSLKNLLSTKAPFGYFSMVKDEFGNLSTSTEKTADITIPGSIKNYILLPVDTAIGAILWFFFLLNFYKRLKFITV